MCIGYIISQFKNILMHPWPLTYLPDTYLRSTFLVCNELCRFLVNGLVICRLNRWCKTRFGIMFGVLIEHLNFYLLLELNIMNIQYLILIVNMYLELVRVMLIPCIWNQKDKQLCYKSKKRILFHMVYTQPVLYHTYWTEEGRLKNLLLFFHATMLRATQTTIPLEKITQ